ncbi:hypothetical protein D3C78_1881210 [compost metagenome]
MKMVTNGGTLHSASTSTSSKGRNVHSETVTFCSSSLKADCVSKLSGDPSKVNPTRASSREGTEVHRDSLI